MTVATGLSTPASAASTLATTGHPLRYWGVLVFVMFLLTSAVGGSLALEGSYLLVTLVSHIGLAVVTLIVAGFASSFVGRFYQPLPRAAAGIAALAALGATLAGTAYLLSGNGVYPLDAMEGFAVIGLVAAIVMTAVGGPSGKRAPIATSI